MKPILFNTEMVKAILDGHKSVTRRVVKPQPLGGVKTLHQSDLPGRWRSPGEDVWIEIRAPYQPGDILYVRETWAKQWGLYWHKAGLAVDKNGCDTYGTIVPTKWRPSIHMPKEAARLFLRVTDVRVERLQEIDYADCKAEGIWDDYKVSSEEYHEALMKLAYPETFANLWDSTIKKADLPIYGWEANPWTWVIEFERISKEEAWGLSTDE